MLFAGYREQSNSRPSIPYIQELLTGEQTKALDAQNYFESYRSLSVSPQSTYWDLLDAARAHPWLRMAIASIGRSIIGSGWSLKEVEGEFPKKYQKKELLEFFSSAPDRDYSNIKDFYGTAAKLYLTAGCLRLFGVAAWEPVRNGFGKAIGFDYVWGYILPNIEKDGAFRSPAWKVYPSRNHLHRPIEYERPEDLIFFPNPDFGGNAYSSDMEAGAKFSLPSDIWAMISYLKLHSERMAPYDGIWKVDPSVSDDEFERTKALLAARYLSAERFGRNPIVARGDLDFVPTRRGEDEMPYREGRDMNRQEIVGLAGTTGAQVGVSEDATRANLAQLRKQTHEMTILPLTTMIEEVIYNQVCVREFNARGWRFHFNTPDFLTVIERSGVGLRLRERGAMTRNEFRAYVLPHLDSRTEGGDNDWLYPTNMAAVGSMQGGAPENPDLRDPAGDEDQVPGNDPPRTDDPDQHRQFTAYNVLVRDELRKWKTFYARTLKGERRPRPFNARFIPKNLSALIDGLIGSGADSETILATFDEVIGMIHV